MRKKGRREGRVELKGGGGGGVRDTWLFHRK